MRKIILALSFALALGACATFKNPATPAGVSNVDATVGAIAAALNSYRSLCIQRASFVYPSCVTIYPKLSASLLIVRGQVRQAVAFINTNPGDTVTLTALVSQATTSINQLKADTKANLPATLTVGIQ